MHHRALRRANVDTQGPRDGMGHREEINRDGSQLNMRATLNLAELGGAQFKLGQFTLNETKGELAREDGNFVIEVLQQIR